MAAKKPKTPRQELDGFLAKFTPEIAAEAKRILAAMEHGLQVIACVGETEPADHRRQQQALAHEGDQDHGKREKQNQVAVRKRLAIGGR